MKKYLFFLFYCISIPTISFSQENNTITPINISGTIFSEKNSEPLPFANIHNISSSLGAIFSNFKGYFEIAINSFNDSIIVSYIGYQPLVIPLKKDTTSYQIKLKESVQMLKTVDITPINNDHLFDLIIACRKKTRKEIQLFKSLLSIEVIYKQ